MGANNEIQANRSGLFGLCDQLRSRFNTAVDEYKNGPRGLCRSLGLAAVPGVTYSAMTMGMGNQGSVALMNVFFGVAGGFGPNSGPVAVVGGAAVLGILLGGSAFTFVTSTRPYYEFPKRILIGTLAGAALSGIMTSCAILNAPKPAPQAVPTGTIQINATGACENLKISDSVELKDGEKQYMVITPKDCPLKATP